MANPKNNGETKKNGAPTTINPHFNIQNVEGDIRRKHLPTEEICSKYGRTVEEVHALIRRSYRNSQQKVKKLMDDLVKNDRDYQRRKPAQERKEEATPVQAIIPVEEKKTPFELQEIAVQNAKDEVFRKELELREAKTEQEKAVKDEKTAKEDKAQAEARLAEAKKALQVATDKKRMANSKVYDKEQELLACREHFALEEAKLNEMSTKKLVHISAITGELPAGKLYMSAYDYAKLSAADQEKVTLVNTEDSTFTCYPDDFFMYPAKLGMDGYQSACSYALAYVKLFLDNQDQVEIELVCNDETVKALAAMQVA